MAQRARLPGRHRTGRWRPADTHVTAEGDATPDLDAAGDRYPEADLRREHLLGAEYVLRRRGHRHLRRCELLVHPGAHVANRMGAAQRTRALGTDLIART